LQELQIVGIINGDNSFVHNSLKAVGKIDSGADTLIDVLLEAVVNMKLYFYC
jgi:aminoglycoside N3'-acetyltransferase